MKYIDEERFIVGARDPEAQRKYSENWDRMFSDPPVAFNPACHACDDTGMTMQDDRVVPCAECPECEGCSRARCVKPCPAGRR